MTKYKANHEILKVQENCAFTEKIVIPVIIIIVIVIIPKTDTRLPEI